MTELKQLPAFIAKVAAPWQAWMTMAAGAVSQFLWPTEALKNMALAAGIFFIADTLSGLTAAWVNKELSSNGARRVFVKFIGYTIYMTVAAAVPLLIDVEFFRQYELFPITAIMGGIAYTELISVFENLKKMEVVLDSRFLMWLGPVLERIKGPEKAPAEALGDIHAARRPDFDDPLAVRDTDVPTEEGQ